MRLFSQNLQGTFKRVLRVTVAGFFIACAALLSLMFLLGIHSATTCATQRSPGKATPAYCGIYRTAPLSEKLIGFTPQLVIGSLVVAALFAVAAFFLGKRSRFVFHVSIFAWVLTFAAQLIYVIATN
jgi:hypothetical protein